MKKVVVIGCGAAGMMAAINLARKGNKVVIIEKNEKAGKKLFITGKGRCNLANDCDEETFLKNVVSNPKFMYSSIYGFNPQMTKEFFENIGLKVKVERGNRMFPVSDHSSDVIGVLVRELKRLDVDIIFNTKVKKIICEETEDENSGKILLKATNVVLSNSSEVSCDAVVIATGGYSYQSTGSTGDGYIFAEEMGLKTVKPRPALVPICMKEDACKNLMGVSLKNISVKFYITKKNKPKCIYEDFGEMLFTHFGVSGPVILSASSKISKYMDEEITMYLDFKPAIPANELDARILHCFENNQNKQLRNAISELLPQSMLLEVIGFSGVDMYKKVNEVSKEERAQIVNAFKNFKLTVTGTRNFDEAIITQGGIAVSEINPQNMLVKKTANVYAAGEVLDLDAFTGGFNLQIAWSTAMAIDID